jgi:hypothetical protein
MDAARQLEPEKRDTFRQRLAASLRINGIRKPTDVDLERALRAALCGLLQEPVA